MATSHIVSLVFNGVKGDSRVIKTAKAAINAGYRATLVGVSATEAVQEMEVEGVSVVLVPHHGKRLRKRGLWGGEKRDIRVIAGSYLNEVLPHIVGLEPDIIHSHDMIGVKIGASAVRAVRANGRSVRWIHDIHEFVAGLKGELQEQHIPACLAWERNHFPEADHLITVSHALADEVARRYPVTRPTVTFNCPNASRHRDSGPDVRGAVGLADGAALVVFVGGATTLRGCDTILDAIAQLPDVHLMMVSQGLYVDQLSARAKTIGMAERFHVHPYVASDEVTSFIRTGNVGIHGLVHYPNAEVAMPNKMFEYLHAGLPVVVSDVESMKKFVEMHDVGCSFVAEDVASCASAVRRALDNRAEYQANITPEIKAKYSWEAQERKLQAIYADLLQFPVVVPGEAERASAAAWVQTDRAMYERLVVETEQAMRSESSVPPKLRPELYKVRRLLSIARKDGLRAGVAVAWGAIRQRLIAR